MEQRMMKMTGMRLPVGNRDGTWDLSWEEELRVGLQTGVDGMMNLFMSRSKELYFYKMLMDFLRNLGAETRFGPPHISLYLMLLDNWMDRGCPDQFRVRSCSLWKQAKISDTTYYRVMGDLHERGWIVYEPDRFRGRSKVGLVRRERNEEKDVFLSFK